MATRTTTPSAPSSRASAAAIPTPPSTGWRKCSTPARTRGSSRGAWSLPPARTSAWPTRRDWWWPWPPSRRWNLWACPRAGSPWLTPPFTSPPPPRATAATPPSDAALQDVASGRTLAVPAYLKDTHVPGSTPGYRYSHDYPGELRPPGLPARRSTVLRTHRKRTGKTHQRTPGILARPVRGRASARTLGSGVAGGGAHAPWP